MYLTFKSTLESVFQNYAVVLVKWLQDEKVDTESKFNLSYVSSNFEQLKIYYSWRI